LLLIAHHLLSSLHWPFSHKAPDFESGSGGP
jgi:hypothetical protein